MSLVWLFENLRTEPFGVIPVNNLSGKGGPTTLKRVETLATYNWLPKASEPTLVIPGAPKELKNWSGGKLPEDQGTVVYDVNHQHLPHCPLEPLFHAIFVQQSDQQQFDLQQYDLVTDCINLQKLFTFCKADETCGFFRIDLERVGKTVIASRVEAQDTIDVDFLSYDQNMKRACCAPLQPELDGSHFRVVSYEFGDLRLLVNVEVDCAEMSQQERAVCEIEPIFDTSQQKPSSSLPQTAVRHLVSRPFQPQTLMTVTTSPDGRGFPAFVWPMLFFSALDSVMIGWWTGQGAFKKPVIYRLADANRLAKPLPYSTLNKLYDLLQKILKFMRRNEQTMQTSLVWRGQQFVEIYEKAPAASGAISPALRSHFDLAAAAAAASSEERLQDVANS